MNAKVKSFILGFISCIVVLVILFFVFYLLAERSEHISPGSGAFTEDSLSNVAGDTSFAMKPDTSFMMKPDSTMHMHTDTTGKVVPVKIIRDSSTSHHHHTPGKKTAIHKTTTAKKQTHQKIKTGILGYSFFKKMSRKETKTINVFVTVNNPAGFVEDTLKQIQNSMNVTEKKNDTSVVYTVNILLYRFLNISLKDPAQSFKIDTLIKPTRQMIDTVLGNRWEWAITPNTNEKEANLYLLVNAEKPDGSNNQFKDQLIPITINIENDWFRTFILYCKDNPGVVITAILIPLAAYFGKRYFDKKNNNK